MTGQPAQAARGWRTSSQAQRSRDNLGELILHDVRRQADSVYVGGNWRERALTAEKSGGGGQYRSMDLEARAVADRAPVRAAAAVRASRSDGLAGCGPVSSEYFTSGHSNVIHRQSRSASLSSCWLAHLLEPTVFLHQLTAIDCRPRPASDKTSSVRPSRTQPPRTAHTNRT